MSKNRRDLLIEYLSGFVMEERIERLQQVLSLRTHYITIALEDIYQPHNAAAVLRSADCFGIQHVHIIENFNKLDISKGVTKKSHQWLTLHRYNKKIDPALDQTNTPECIGELKRKGYTVVATSPHSDGYLLSELPIGKPVAVLFGAEKNGLSETALEQADVHVRIPMFGFSESLNLSVSAALCLYELVHRMRDKVPQEQWMLPVEEQKDLMLEWLRLSVRASKKLEERFLKGV